MRNSLLVLVLFLSIVSCRQQLEVSEIRTENISNSPTEFLPDSNIIKLVKPYREALEKDMNEVIAITDEPMYKKKPESNLTNFLSDLLLEEATNYCQSEGYEFTPDVAYMNYGGIRSSLPEGEVTVGNVFELMPFENEMVILEMTGADLEQFAAQIAHHGGDAVAGVTIGIKDDELTEFKINGKEVNDDQSYFFVTNDYVAGGGDGMGVFSKRKQYIATGLKLRDVFISNMRAKYKAGQKIDSQKDGRIYYE